MSIFVTKDTDNMCYLRINICQLIPATDTNQIETFDNTLIGITEPLVFNCYNKYNNPTSIVLNPDGSICTLNPNQMMFISDIVQIILFKIILPPLSSLEFEHINEDPMKGVQEIEYIEFELPEKSKSTLTINTKVKKS